MLLSRFSVIAVQPLSFTLGFKSMKYKTSYVFPNISAFNRNGRGGLMIQGEKGALSYLENQGGVLMDCLMILISFLNDWNDYLYVSFNLILLIFLHMISQNDPEPKEL